MADRPAEHPYVRASQGLHARIDAAVTAAGGLGDLGELAQILQDRADSAGALDASDPDWLASLLDRPAARSGSLHGQPWLVTERRLLPPPDLDDSLVPRRGRNGLPTFDAELWVLVGVTDDAPVQGLWLRGLEPNLPVQGLLRFWTQRTYPRIYILYRADKGSDDFGVEAVLLPTNREGGPPVLIMSRRAEEAVVREIPAIGLRGQREGLRETDLDLIDVIARGHTTKVAAARLGIAARTLENRRKRLVERLGVAPGRPGLTELAGQLGLGPGYPERRGPKRLPPETGRPGSLSTEVGDKL